MIDYVIFSQVITLIISIVGIIYIMFWAHSAHRWWNYTIPIFLFLVHQSIYYSTLLYIEFMYGVGLAEFFGLAHLAGEWSAILRTHGTITIFFSVITVKFQIVRFFRKDFIGLIDNDIR